MKNILATLAASTAIGLASMASAADDSGQVKSEIEYKKNGGYESTVESEKVTEAGTKKTSSGKVDVDIDSNGRMEKNVKTETVTDAKGLLNKTKDKSETNIEEKARGGYKQITTRTHADANGTNTTYKTVTDVDVDADGNVTSTAVTEKTVDPKGLMNKKTSTSKTKSVNGTVTESN